MELLSNAEMVEADRLAIAGGVAGIDLMENAGTAVAEAAATYRRGGSRVAVVAGPGNNGGDGFVAARVLAERGYRVEVLMVGAASRLRGDAALAAKRWRGPVAVAAPDGLDGADVVIDALFGAGLDRPVEGAARTMIEAMNAHGAPVIAVDLPSGINGTSGVVMGVAVKATRTVTFFRKKSGHLLIPGRLHCGSILVADIGIPSSVLARVAPQTFENLPALWRAKFPVPRPDGHKYHRGHAVVVSGPMWSTGAARLAARGALRAGAGLVTIASPREALAVNAADNLAVMVRPVDGAAELAAFLADRRLNALAIGPGMGVGEATGELVLAALSGGRGVVLDADAITSFSATPQHLAAALKARHQQATILTPHDGEFYRYFSELDGRTKVGSKLERARLAANITGVVVLIKGADTVVAAPDGRASIAANAPAYLATAGAGDVLTGMAAGLLAQGMPAFEAASAAVWLHGEAAAAFGPGLISEDLPETLPRVYQALLG
ncbi:MAG TPA: NAD(P)H-hydrate dehydratase [Xanthobacteraceae bacterium]|nr:NAD(P)H-hydrate dehydratase [Xanthobacteraceae bacterium]